MRVRPPTLFALYVAWYTFGRTFEELLRVDPSHHLLGMRIDFWVSILVFLGASGFALWWRRRAPWSASAHGGSLHAMIVRELELDLDAFAGPFDLLLTLVLKEELETADVDVAGVVVAFVERLAEREQLDLDACGEFLVLVSALLELKARASSPRRRPSWPSSSRRRRRRSSRAASPNTGA